MLKYGLLGGGMMGQEHLRNLAIIPGTEVVAIAEPNADMATRCKKMVPQATIVASLDELLAHDFDALIIATPNFQHADQLVESLQRPDLAILIEKPLVTEAQDILRIMDATTNHRAPIWVAMEYRYMPPLVEFRNQLNVIGPIQTLSIREHRFPFLKKVDDWNRFNSNSGGTLVEKCCHFFDLFRLLMNDEVSHIYASTGQNVNHLNESYGGKTPDIIDNAFVTMEFSQNKRGLLDLNMFAQGSAYQEELCAIGPNAKLECLIPGPEFNWSQELPLPQAKLVMSPRKPRHPIETPVTVDEAIMAAGSHHGSTYYEHVGFKSAVENNSPVEVTITDGLKAVALGMAGQLSAQQRQVVAMSNDGLSFEVQS